MEAPSFYERCDRMGILMWQELFLHSNVYPDYDPAFVREFLAESEDVLRRVRGHPCLCLISGGNEQLEGWDEWGWRTRMDRFHGERLIREALPPLAARMCPELPYICNSPHGGKWAQSPVEGECHNWGNFYNATKDPVFVTETCWTTESYSRPETLKRYMGLDVDAFRGKGWPDRWRERTGLPLFTRMPYSRWHEMDSLRDYLHSLEVEQFCADRSALSQYRFHSPSNRGVIYWSMNKGGPLFQFGCVDYGGFPLMAYYAVKRAFAPVAVHAYRDVCDVVVMLSSHAAEGKEVLVEAFHLGRKGTERERWSRAMHLEHGELLCVMRLEGLYNRVADRTGECVYVCVRGDDGTAVADDLLLFCPLSEFDSTAGKPRADAESRGEGRWRLTVSSDRPIHMVELEGNHKLLFSDNYFPLMPGAENRRMIEVTLLERLSDEPVRLCVGGLGGGAAGLSFKLTQR